MASGDARISAFRLAFNGRGNACCRQLPGIVALDAAVRRRANLNETSPRPDRPCRAVVGPARWSGSVLSLTAFALGPFLWMLLTLLKDRQELYATPLQYLPMHPAFENYIDAWTSPVTPFSRFFSAVSFSVACG
jgi:hypothetical protein